MLTNLLVAFAVFIIVGVALSLAGIPYAWLIALAVGILVFALYGPVYGSRRSRRPL